MEPGRDKENSIQAEEKLTYSHIAHKTTRRKRD